MTPNADTMLLCLCVPLFGCVLWPSAVSSGQPCYRWQLLSIWWHVEAQLSRVQKPHRRPGRLRH